jgi:hypothetical protein
MLVEMFRGVVRVKIVGWIAEVEVEVEVEVDC